MTQTTWATEADVETTTGVTITAAQLAQAAAVIDMEAGRTYLDVSRIGARDQYWLKLALCYQAAWLTANPDLFQRIEVEAEGTKGQLTKFSPTGLVLAPYAKRALKRVSWLKSRSLHVQSPFADGIGVLGTDPLSSGADGLYPWSAVED
jgi:hypothetical protein